MDLISCLCISKNNVDIVSQSIKSFLGQTYPNKELIFVYEDNNKYITEIKKKFSNENIVYLQQKNDENIHLGLLRNTSIQHSKGKYVIQWDDDDIYHENRIETQLTFLKQNNKKAVMLDQRFISIDGKMYLSNVWPFEGSILAEKEVISNLYCNKKKGEDTDVLKILLDNNDVSFLNCPNLYLYRYHYNNVFDKKHWMTIINNSTYICDLPEYKQKYYTIHNILEQLYCKPNKSKLDLSRLSIIIDRIVQNSKELTTIQDNGSNKDPQENISKSHSNNKKRKKKPNKLYTYITNLDNKTIPFFYINLDRSIDRKEYFETQIGDKYPVFRIEAIDYKKDPFENVIKNNNTEDKFYAVLGSHLKAIYMADKYELDSVIITEDDIELDIFLKSKDKIFQIWEDNKDKLECLQLHSSGNVATATIYQKVLQQKKVELVKKTDDTIVYWGCTMYIINRKGIKKIMKYYDTKLKKFNLSTLHNLKMLSDNIIYRLCNSYILNVPCINIANPNQIPSTIQENRHTEMIHIPSYSFIDKNKENFITILENYSKENTRNNNILSRVVNDTDNIKIDLQL